MADKKAERLINLTLALLATKRYLKKSEIFATVDGYSGNADAMDRMFERDKNELRSLGIEISVGDLDPLFDDEPGYRINKDSYGLQLKNLSPADVAILSVAANIWNDSILGIDAQSSLIKLESVGLFDAIEDNLAFSYKYENPTPNLIVIEEAISQEQVISFKYRDGSAKRRVEPYRIYLWRGFWCLFGKDTEKNQNRSFKISRIPGEITLEKSKFKQPDNLDVNEFLPSFESFKVLISIPEAKCAILRNLASNVEHHDGYDICEILFPDSDSAITQLLRHGAEAKVLEPSALRETLRSKLESIAYV